MLIIIVTIIDLDLEELLLLEAIHCWDLLDKLGEQVVVNGLCFSKFAPFSVNHLEQDSKRVRLRAILMKIQVGQVFAAKAQREFGGQGIRSSCCCRRWSIGLDSGLSRRQHSCIQVIRLPLVVTRSNSLVVQMVLGVRHLGGLGKHTSFSILLWT